VDVLLDRLREIVGPLHVLVDADVRASYEVDWTGRFAGSTPAVVRPGTTSELAAVVVACAESRRAIVPQGGNTGLVGGSVPLHGEIVVSTRRLDRLGDVDVVAGEVTAGAGVTLDRLQDHARRAGLAFGVDLAARQSATVGGMVATNAGGLNFVRHGGMRQQLVGIEAVMADGSVVSRLERPPKDNTGYDLAQLLCGSEGTLGVVTAARVQLVPSPESTVTALAAVPDLTAAVTAINRLRDRGVPVQAAEGFFDEGMALVCGHLGLTRPLAPSPAYLLVEWEGVADAFALTGLDDAVLAVDDHRRAELWRFREAHTESVNTLGIPHKLDVAVTPSKLDELVRQVRATVAGMAPDAVLVLFGHVADGNVHVNVVGPDPDDDRLDDAIVAVVLAMGGSISAEHGIGTAKRAWLGLARSSAELNVYRRVKRALDPDGILNPHVLL
jgi:FAD/FMN-containing dehydrogenase